MATSQNQSTSTGNVQSGIYKALKSLGLERHFTHTSEFGINLDSFINMTEVDMGMLGITLSSDQAVLKEFLNRLKTPTTDFMETLGSHVEDLVINAVKNCVRFRTLTVGILWHNNRLMSDSQVRYINGLKEIVKTLDRKTCNMMERLRSPVKDFPKEYTQESKARFKALKAINEATYALALGSTYKDLYKLSHLVFMQV